MSRIDIARQIAFLDALGGAGGPPLSSRDMAKRERLITELDHFDDEGWDAQKRLRRLEGINRARLGAKLMRRDLDVDDDAWRRLMRGAWLLWRVAMDDHEMRHDPNKPKKRLEDNWDPDEEVAYDYGDDAGAGLEDWDQFWADVYYTRPGRRWPGTPLGPLYEVFLLVRDWWMQYTGKTTFGLDYSYRSDREDFNAAGRLFLNVAQALDGRYTAKACASVYNKWRERRK